jgi:hypothetical protein
MMGWLDLSSFKNIVWFKFKHSSLWLSTDVKPMSNDLMHTKSQCEFSDLYDITKQLFLPWLLGIIQGN